MKIKLKYLVLLCFTMVMFNCETDDGVESELSNFVGFEISSEPFRVVTVEGNTTSGIEVAVYASEVSSSDRSFGLFTSEELHNELILDQFGQAAITNNTYPFLEAAYQLPESVTIPAGSNKGTFVMSITDDESLGFDSQFIPVSLESGNGVEVANPVMFSVTQACTDTIVTLDLAFDNWAEEASYDIFDLSGTPTVILSGGQGGVWTDLDNDSLVVEFCLASGEYGIVVYDSYGDGGTVFSVSAGGEVLASGTVPGGNPANVEISTSATFTID